MSKHPTPTMVCERMQQLVERLDANKIDLGDLRDQVQACQTELLRAPTSTELAELCVFTNALQASAAKELTKRGVTQN